MKHMRLPTYILLVRLEELLIRQGIASVYSQEVQQGKEGPLVLGTVYNCLSRWEKAGWLKRVPPRPGCQPSRGSTEHAFFAITDRGRVIIPEYVNRYRERFTNAILFLIRIENERRRGMQR